MKQLKDTFAQDEIHDRWESVYRGNPIQDRFNDQIMDRVIRHLNPPPDALFLDAGCGRGSHTLEIARRGFRCVGVDISESVLRNARRRVEMAALGTRAHLVCQGLEDLGFRDNSFDVIYCRGVLMHIPAWEEALGHLCRVLKPNGMLVILELNHTSIETCIVRAVRQLRAGQSRMVETVSGLEFWSDEHGKPFVARIANVASLLDQLRNCGVQKVGRFATEFWDINRFPSGFLRNLAIRFNQLWFLLHLPSFPSMGNAIIGQKKNP